ncbi:MAG: hypothetical protein RIS70_1552 [Planctomycetota bacterium]|jgi:hypothetical protein
MHETNELRQLILAMTGQRGVEKSICPSEVARTADPHDWRRLMDPVREEAIRLAREGAIELLQGGNAIDPGEFRGPIRLRQAKPAASPSPPEQPE